MFNASAVGLDFLDVLCEHAHVSSGRMLSYFVEPFVVHFTVSGDLIGAKKPEYMVLTS